MDLGPDEPQLGQPDALFGHEDRGAAAVLAAVGGEGIPPGLFRFKLGVAEGRRVPEEVQKRPPEVLMNRAQRLAVYFF